MSKLRHAQRWLGLPLIQERFGSLVIMDSTAVGIPGIGEGFIKHPLCILIIKSCPNQVLIVELSRAPKLLSENRIKRSYHEKDSAMFRICGHFCFYY